MESKLEKSKSGSQRGSCSIGVQKRVEPRERGGVGREPTSEAKTKGCVPSRILVLMTGWRVVLFTEVEKIVKRMNG